MSTVLQPVVSIEVPVPVAGPSVLGCPNRACPRFGTPSGYIDDGTDEPVGGPCPVCSTCTDQVPATVWGLPGWAAKVDTRGMDDAIAYESRIGEVPALDAPPVTVDTVGADCLDLTGLMVAVNRQPFVVRVAGVRLRPDAARRLAGLLTAAAALVESPH